MQKEYKIKGLSQSGVKKVLLSRLIGYEIEQGKSKFYYY